MWLSIFMFDLCSLVTLRRSLWRKLHEACLICFLLGSSCTSFQSRNTHAHRGWGGCSHTYTNGRIAFFPGSKFLKLPRSSTPERNLHSQERPGRWEASRLLPGQNPSSSPCATRMSGTGLNIVCIYTYIHTICTYLYVIEGDDYTTLDKNWLSQSATKNILAFSHVWCPCCVSLLRVWWLRLFRVELHCQQFGQTHWSHFSRWSHDFAKKCRGPGFGSVTLWHW